MKEILDFLKIFSSDQIKYSGKHFRNVANLYTKPLTNWKRILRGHDENSFNLFFLVVLYYSLFLFLLLEDYRLIIKCLLVDILLTIIPYLFLLVPLFVFKKIVKHKIKAAKLFRLVFVLKVQLNSILMILLYASKWSGIEWMYSVAENFLLLILLAIISVPIIITSLSKWKKVILITGSFSMIQIYSIIFYLLFMKSIGAEKLQERFTIFTPNSEFLQFNENYQNSEMMIDEEFYIVHYEFVNSRLEYKNTQFAVRSIINNVRLVQLYKEKAFIKKIDYIKNNLGYSINSNWEKPDKSIFQLKKIDSIRNDFTKVFYNDKKKADSLKDIVAFSSNKTIFKLRSSLLKTYDSIYTDVEAIQSYINKEPYYSIKLSDKDFAVIYPLDMPSIKHKQKEILVWTKNFQDKLEVSTYMVRAIFFPAAKFLEMSNMM